MTIMGERSSVSEAPFYGRSSVHLAPFPGAWLGGRVFDLLGSYDPVWWLCVWLGIPSAALQWPIREQPVPRLAGVRT